MNETKPQIRNPREVIHFSRYFDKHRSLEIKIKIKWKPSKSVKFTIEVLSSQNIKSIKLEKIFVNETKPLVWKNKSDRRHLSASLGIMGSSWEHLLKPFVHHSNIVSNGLRGGVHQLDLHYSKRRQHFSDSERDFLQAHFWQKSAGFAARVSVPPCIRCPEILKLMKLILNKIMTLFSYNTVHNHCRIKIKYLIVRHNIVKFKQI